jgi:hypothetical protein
MNTLKPYLTRRNLLIASIGVLAVTLVTLLILQLLKPPVYTASQPFATNMAMTHQVDNQTLYYFNGTAFVSYNLTSHKSTPLTPVYAMPAHVDRVLWSKQGALFQANGYTENDQLYVRLIRQSLNPNSVYWWSVNFKTGAISLIGDAKTGTAAVYSAVWESEDRFVYNEEFAGKTTLTTMRSTLDGQLTKLGDTPSQSLLASATPERLTFTKPQGDLEELTVMTLASGQTKVVARTVSQILATNAAGSSLLISKPAATKDLDEASLQAEIPRGTLTLYDAATGKTTSIANEFVGTAAWSGSDWIAAGSNHSKRMGYVSQQGKVTDLQMVSADPKEVTPRFAAIGITDKGFLVANALNQLVYVSKSPINDLPALPDYTTLINTIDSDGYYLTYIEKNHTYAVYILQSPYDENVKAVITRLISLGYDPYQLPLKWYIGGDVQTSFRLLPDEEPIEPPDTIINPHEDSFEDGD